MVTRSFAILVAICLAVTAQAVTAQESSRSIGEATVTAQAVTVQEGSRSIGEATLTALDICANSAFRGVVELGRHRTFLDFPAVAKRRMPPSLGILDDVPALIQRFAATAQFSSLFGVSEITALVADDGQVWVVQTRDRNLCSIAITGVDDKDDIRQSLVSAVGASEVWDLVADSSSSNEALWLESITSRERPDGAMARARVEGLMSEFASPDGIQVELNVRAVPAEAAAGSPSEQEGN